MLEKQIADKIKTLRKSKGYTLESLGEIIGLSKGLLSKIENYQVSPPIATLSKISHGLEVPIGVFFETEEEKEEERYTIIKKNNRKQVNKMEAAAELNYFSLSNLRSLKIMEPFIVNYPAIDKTPTKLYEHTGEEFIFILKGCIDFIYGKDTIPLEKGDAIHFDPSIPHRIINTWKAKSECLVILADTVKT
jgi:transcriptional regulator with XRE-family HTH domain